MRAEIEIQTESSSGTQEMELGNDDEDLENAIVAAPPASQWIQS